VQAAPAVGDGRLGIVAHAGGADLVDGPSGRQELAVHLDVLRARGPEHLFDRIPHVLRHLLLVVAEGVVEAQDGDAPGVPHVGVEGDAVLLAREHLAEAAQADEGRVVLPHR